jgi:hypothetical protein
MINTRHGSFYAIGDILLGLNGKSDLHNLCTDAHPSVFL